MIEQRDEPMAIRNKQAGPQESLPKNVPPPAPAGGTAPAAVPDPGATSIPEVVDRLEDLVKFALECENRELKEGVSFVDVFKQLEEVRKAIEMLDQDQQELLELFSSVTGGAVDVNKVPFTDQDKKTLDKLKHLQSVCEAAKERMYATVKEHPETEAALEEQIVEERASEKKKIVHRKGKFRPLGGKGGWMRT